MYFLLLIVFSLFPIPTSAVDYRASASTSITASIAENRVTIFGYTSKKSRVEVSSPKVFAVTYSDQKGYFIFDKILLPKNPSDLCLISFDNNNRSTHPICIPPPPPTNYHTDIGPILLPPTISLEKDKINPNSTVNTSGQAIPNSIVDIHFYKVKDSALSFPKEAYAYSLPSVTATTDSEGNFSLNLPTAYSSDYRLYASAKFDNDYSPKSNTLVYVLPSLFYLFLQRYPFLYYLIPISLLLTIILIIIFYLRSNIYHLKSKYLPAIANYFPATTSCQIKSPSTPNPSVPINRDSSP